MLTFQGLETTLQSPVKETKAASVDILLFIVDYSPSLVGHISCCKTIVMSDSLFCNFFQDFHESIQVREYMMQQINSTDDDGLLMNIVIEGMICDTGREVIIAFD